MSEQLLCEAAGNYYDTFLEILCDLSRRSSGGEEATLQFPVGTITIKLK